MPLVLALDQGTTGSTALLVDEGGKVLGRGYREIPQIFPQPGWVEHDPEVIWTMTLSAACTSPIRPMRRAPCCTTSRLAPGTTSCSSCSVSTVNCCPT